MKKELLIFMILTLCGTFGKAETVIEESTTAARSTIVYDRKNLNLTSPGKIPNPMLYDSGLILDVPENDNCADAIPVSEVENLFFNSEGATFDGPGACIDMPNIWYLYTPSFTGLVDIKTCSADTFPILLDTRLAVYDGSICYPYDTPPTPRELAGGETIETATPIADNLPISYRSSTAGHNHDYNLSCVFESFAPDVVYSYTAAADGSIMVSLIGSDEEFNTALGIFDGDGYELTCNDDEDIGQHHSRILNFPVTDGRTYYIVVSGGWVSSGGQYLLTVSSPDYTLLACNGDYCGEKSMVTLDAIQGHQLLIEIGGQSGRGDDTVGCGYLSIMPTPTTPENDDCENATQAGVLAPNSSIQLTGNCTGATIDCEAVNDFGEVWVTFTIETTLDIIINFCGTSPFRIMNYSYLTDTCPCDGSIMRCTGLPGYYCPDSVTYITAIHWENLPAGSYWYPISYMPEFAEGPYVLNIVSLSGSGIDEPSGLPSDIELSQNYPNPFNGTTSISFSLAKTEEIKLSVYNVLGQQIKVLHDGILQAGSHSIDWDATDQANNAVSSGIYFCRLESRAGSTTMDMLLLK